MTAPLNTDRWLARLSMLAVFVCFAGNCLAFRFTWQQGAPPAAANPAEAPRELGGGGSASRVGGWVSQVASFVTSGVVVAGIGLGFVAVWRGYRSGDRDTLLVGALGAILNLGIVVVTIWWLWAVRNAAPP